MFDHLNASDSVAVIAFNNKPYLLSKPITNHQSGKSVLRFLAANGQTAMYDTLKSVVRTFKSRTSPVIIVLVADGMDNASTTSRDEVLKRSPTQTFASLRSESEIRATRALRLF